MTHIPENGNENQHRQAAADFTCAVQRARALSIALCLSV